jgi:glycosyltransferase involved in cell wall biosynthesis
MIDVIHDGIDVKEAAPSATAQLVLPRNEGVLRSGDKVVTFVARNLEPYRGVHIFLRALPRILAAHPDAHIVIVGGHDVSYGGRPEDGRSWPSVFMAEIQNRVDSSRIHFMGVVSREVFLQVLQVSAAHVYLTYPFVLSWSMLEAMAAGCLVIGSDTDPVREVIRDGQTGILVPFFSPDALANQVNAALQQPSDYSAIRRAARQQIVEEYAVGACIRRQVQLIDDMLEPKELPRRSPASR